MIFKILNNIIVTQEAALLNRTLCQKCMIINNKTIFQGIMSITTINSPSSTMNSMTNYILKNQVKYSQFLIKIYINILFLFIKNSHR